MKQLLFLLGLIVAGEAALAQAILSYNDGTPAFEKKLTDVEGSELLYPDWVLGQVLTKEGKVYKGQKLKYNQLEDRFYFQSDDGVSMMFMSPVKELVLDNQATGKKRVFRNGFPAVSRLTPDSYYEVLADGKNMLLKKTVKSIIETKEYNSPNIKKYIQDDVQYYFYNGEKLLAVKKDKAAFLEGKKEKEAAIESFIGTSKLNLKKEEDMVKLVQYINTLD